MKEPPLLRFESMRWNGRYFPDPTPLTELEQFINLLLCFDCFSLARKLGWRGDEDDEATIY